MVEGWKLSTIYDATKCMSDPMRLDIQQMDLFFYSWHNELGSWTSGLTWVSRQGAGSDACTTRKNHWPTKLMGKSEMVMGICNWKWTANGDPQWHFWSLGFLFCFVLETKDKIKASAKNELRDKTTIASPSHVNPPWRLPRPPWKKCKPWRLEGMIQWKWLVGQTEDQALLN